MEDEMGRKVRGEGGQAEVKPCCVSANCSGESSIANCLCSLN